MSNEERTDDQTRTNDEPTKEYGFHKPTPFDGNRRHIVEFVQECNLYLNGNKHFYKTDESKVAFMLTYMNKDEAKKWKLTYIESITDDEGDIAFPTHKEFLARLRRDFLPINQTNEAIHQLALLRQGKKSAEEILTEFRHLLALAQFSTTTTSDHAHLIEKLQDVLNPSLVNKVMLSDKPPTTIDGWADRAVQIDNQYRMTREHVEQQAQRTGKPINDKKLKKPSWSNYFGQKKTREEKDPDIMDVDAMSTDKRAALMKRGACFICEKPGHLARDHKAHEEAERKKGKTPERGNSERTQKKNNIKKIHALLSSLSPKETAQLLSMQKGGKKEKEEEVEEAEEKTDDDDEGF